MNSISEFWGYILQPYVVLCFGGDMGGLRNDLLIIATSIMGNEAQ